MRYQNRRFPALAVYLFIIAAFTAADQIVKLYFLSLKRDFDITVWGNYLHFLYVPNRGAAFGIFEGKQLMLVGITSVLIVVCLYFLLTQYFRSKLMNLALSLIIAGGIGNLIDRVVRHFVVDYLYFKFINSVVFNIADVCVCTGAVMLFCYFLQREMFDWRKSRSIKRYGR